MDMRYDMRMDGRRLPPRNSRGEFRRRRSRRDRAMDDFARDMRYDYESDMARGGRGRSGSRGGRSRDYESGDMTMQNNPQMYYDARGYDRASQGYDMRGGMDGHHYPQSQGSTYYPVQAMGTFEGYYGMPEQDYARGGRGRQDYGYDMRYDMRGRGGYGRDYEDDDYGDYGETLSEEELENWCKKLKSQLDEREKQMFSKEMISQKAKQMGKQMEGFGEKELEVATLMVYTDYKHTIGQNVDMAIKLAFDWLTDKDVAVKGAEKLAVYYDCIVEGE